MYNKNICISGVYSKKMSTRIIQIIKVCTVKVCFYFHPTTYFAWQTNNSKIKVREKNQYRHERIAVELSVHRGPNAIPIKRFFRNVDYRQLG